MSYALFSFLFVYNGKLDLSEVLKYWINKWRGVHKTQHLFNILGKYADFWFAVKELIDLQHILINYISMRNKIAR